METIGEKEGEEHDDEKDEQESNGATCLSPFDGDDTFTRAT